MEATIKNSGFIEFLQPVTQSTHDCLTPVSKVPPFIEEVTFKERKDCKKREYLRSSLFRKHWMKFENIKNKMERIIIEVDVENDKLVKKQSLSLFRMGNVLGFRHKKAAGSQDASNDSPTAF